MSDETARIRDLNDRLRTTLEGGRIVTTRGVAALGAGFVSRAIKAVQAFDAFTADNDPHGEHDFGSIEIDASVEKIFWKIDYYDAAMVNGSEDPSDPAQTTRVLTIMLAAEY